MPFLKYFNTILTCNFSDSILQLCGAVCNTVDEDSGVFHSLRLPIRKSKKKERKKERRERRKKFDKARKEFCKKMNLNNRFWHFLHRFNKYLKKVKKKKKNKKKITLKLFLRDYRYHSDDFGPDLVNQIPEYVTYSLYRSVLWRCLQQPVNQFEWWPIHSVR